MTITRRSDNILALISLLVAPTVNQTGGWVTTIPADPRQSQTNVEFELNQICDSCGQSVHSLWTAVSLFSER